MITEASEDVLMVAKTRESASNDYDIELRPTHLSDS
jgi:hypothetical protein